VRDWVVMNNNTMGSFDGVANGTGRVAAGAEGGGGSSSGGGRMSLQCWPMGVTLLLRASTFL